MITFHGWLFFKVQVFFIPGIPLTIDVDCGKLSRVDWR